MDWTALIDVVVLLGVAVVCPLALGHPRWWWATAAVLVVAVLLPTGPAAAAFAAVWVLVAGTLLVRATGAGVTALTAAAERRSSGDLVELAVRVGPPAFAVVAALAFAASRGGITPFGVDEPIVELTAVHFTYAGVGALTLAGAVSRRRTTLRAAAVALTVAAPPVVAIGFLTHHPLPQIGGAVLMSAGVWLVAGLQLREAWTGTTPRRTLLTISGAAPWVPMVLAVAWATSLYVQVPALSIPDMARTHGVLNVVFVIAGLLARRGATVAPVPSAADADATLERVAR